MFLPIAPRAGPTRGNTPPIREPSAPYRNLFLKFAATLSLPVKFSTSSNCPTNLEDKSGSSNISVKVLYGPPATKSAAPKASDVVPARFAILDICTPYLGSPSRPYVFLVNKYLSALPFVAALIDFLNLLIILNAILPGIPNSTASAPILPMKVSGSARSISSYCLFTSSVNSVGNTASGIDKARSETLYPKLANPFSCALFISSIKDM